MKYNLLQDDDNLIGTLTSHITSVDSQNEVISLVKTILDDVKHRGDEAVLEKTLLYDKADLSPQQMIVTADELESAELRLSVDEKTSLKENLLVRPSSQIVDFKVLDESNDQTHFTIKIQAAVFHGPDDIDCNMNKKINLSYLKPKFIVSSKLPAWTNNLPAVISQSIFLNLQSLDKINLINKDSFYVDTNKVNKVSHELDYESLTEDSIRIKNGEYSVIPEIKLDFAKSRLHRFSN